MDIAEQVVVVTGAAQGLGADIAHAFLERGARVALWDVKPRVQEVARILDPALQRAIPATVDITDEEALRYQMGLVIERFGTVHTLICNAKWNTRALVHEMPKVDWERTVAVSLTGAFLSIKQALPTMMSQKFGNIITLSSVHVKGAYPGFSAYDASKGGLEALTRQVAVDYGPWGIRCNAVAPGLVVAPDHPQRDQLWKRFAKYHPARRLATPTDVSQAILYLASDAAAFVNGQCLTVDGGLTAQSPEIWGYESNRDVEMRKGLTP